MKSKQNGLNGPLVQSQSEKSARAASTMREITLNGYIDESVFWGDEITPEGLHEALYGENNQYKDDVHIRFNSYGGSCNAATRMFDDIRAYPGNVKITISGTAASAGSVVAMAADRLEMSPGSILMIHDPSVVAWGNEQDLMEAVGLLKASKESILNVYAKRCQKKREDVAAMMTETTWMDATSALKEGFIDGISSDEITGVSNHGRVRRVDRSEAEAKVKAWFERQLPHLQHAERMDVKMPQGAQANDEPVCPYCNAKLQPVDNDDTQEPLPEKPNLSCPDEGKDHTSAVEQTAPEDRGKAEQPEQSGIPIAQLEKRLGLIQPSRR